MCGFIARLFHRINHLTCNWSELTEKSKQNKKKTLNDLSLAFLINLVL